MTSKCYNDAGAEKHAPVSWRDTWHIAIWMQPPFYFMYCFCRNAWSQKFNHESHYWDVYSISPTYIFPASFRILSHHFSNLPASKPKDGRRIWHRRPRAEKRSVVMHPFLITWQQKQKVRGPWHNKPPDMTIESYHPQPHLGRFSERAEERQRDSVSLRLCLWKLKLGLDGTVQVAALWVGNCNTCRYNVSNANKHTHIRNWMGHICVSAQKHPLEKKRDISWSDLTHSKESGSGPETI